MFVFVIIGPKENLKNRFLVAKQQGILVNVRHIPDGNSDFGIRVNGFGAEVLLVGGFDDVVVGENEAVLMIHFKQNETKDIDYFAPALLRFCQGLDWPSTSTRLYYYDIDWVLYSEGSRIPPK